MEVMEISWLRLIYTIKFPATAASSAGLRALLLLAFSHSDADAASQWLFWRALLNSLVFVFRASVGARGPNATPTQWHFRTKCISGTAEIHD